MYAANTPVVFCTRDMRGSGGGGGVNGRRPLFRWPGGCACRNITSSSRPLGTTAAGCNDDKTKSNSSRLTGMVSSSPTASIACVCTPRTAEREGW